jgi:uncharacterized lipoprotein YbaY/heat shock protein HslJ
MRLPLFLCSAAAVIAFGVFSFTPVHAHEGDSFVTVSGSVTYRQRIAMPPDALLTVRVEDVSWADAPALAVAEARELFGTRQVPIEFSLNVPRASIDSSFSYAVRATVSINSELHFTTTRSYPVLTGGATNRVNLLLEAVQQSAAQARTPLASLASGPAEVVGFTLPATFTGVMPCADCSGISQNLMLRADGLYRLQRTYLGKPGGPFTELGRWEAGSGGTLLTLRSGSKVHLFAVTGDESLRQLDSLGQPITSTANLELRRTAQIGQVSVPAELKDTYWKLVELDGRKVGMVPEQRREVRITLVSEGSRLSAFGGCNQLGGGYLLEGNALRFTQMAGTMMACEPPVMDLES